MTWDRGRAQMVALAQDTNQYPDDGGDDRKELNNAGAVEVGGQLHEHVPSGHKLNTADALSRSRPMSSLAMRASKEPDVPGASFEVVLADARSATWHCLHLLLSRLCSQVLDPPHYLHWLFMRLCLQMIEPPHNLHLFLSRTPTAPVAYCLPRTVPRVHG